MRKKTMRGTVLLALFAVVTAGFFVGAPGESVAAQTSAETGRTVLDYDVSLDFSVEATPLASCPGDTWGNCRDICYDGRNDCFDKGHETEKCESDYDTCTAWCDDAC